MKIYNPFKPHLCKNSDGTYSVRTLSFYGWLKRDINQDYWWSVDLYSKERSHIISEVAALALLKKVKTKQIKLQDNYIPESELEASIEKSKESRKTMT